MGGELHQAWLDARSRAFRQLDEWLTWDCGVDDESVYASEGVPPRIARFESVLNEVIADPADALHDSLRTFSVLRKIVATREIRPPRKSESEGRAPARPRILKKR